jgi:ubiquinone/menaquinone biosynthesis C-methylase UbiE
MASDSFLQAKQRADAVAGSPAFDRFVDIIRERFPWRFENMPRATLDRDYLRIVDHHLQHLMPHVERYMDPKIKRVLDFGCGSGGSAIALALVHPDVHCCGTDIDEQEISIARERARLYNVADRCEFHHVRPCESLPLPANSFDFSLCSSVLEYAIEVDVRRFCVQEMARMVAPNGLLFFAVPNRLYPFEIHTRKWGWNYFPKLLNARTIDCTAWEVKTLAKPTVLKFHRTPVSQFFRPWSAFCLRRES